MAEPSPADRADHYRQMAIATRDLADRTQDPDIKSSYLDLAERWQKLAQRAAKEPRTFADTDEVRR
jgi:hypothetical protein